MLCESYISLAISNNNNKIGRYRTTKEEGYFKVNQSLCRSIEGVAACCCAFTLEQIKVNKDMDKINNMRIAPTLQHVT
jgi:hypothetical protein